MSPISKLRFVFNSGGWWGFRMKGLNTRMKGEHKGKERRASRGMSGIDGLKLD